MVPPIVSGAKPKYPNAYILYKSAYRVGIIATIYSLSFRLRPQPLAINVINIGGLVISVVNLRYRY
jgi:hypothetical protein